MLLFIFLRCDNELFCYTCKLRGYGISREALEKVENAYKRPTEEEKRIGERLEIVTADRVTST